MAMPRYGGLPYAAAPARATTAKREIPWYEPEPWMIAVVLATGVAVGFRHPIARMLGTEVADNTVSTTVVSTGTAPEPTAAATAAARAVVAAAVPTHRPRDPFHALVSAGSAVIAPDAAVPVAGTTVVTAQPQAIQPSSSRSSSTPAAAGSSTCAGTTHTVVAGDTLWTLSAHAVKSADTGRITVAWHRLYKANQPPLGSNPSVLSVGTKLCIPDTL